MDKKTPAKRMKLTNGDDDDENDTNESDDDYQPSSSKKKKKSPHSKKAAATPKSVRLHRYHAIINMRTQHICSKQFLITFN